MSNIELKKTVSAYKVKNNIDSVLKKNLSIKCTWNEQLCNRCDHLLLKMNEVIDLKSSSGLVIHDVDFEYFLEAKKAFLNQYQRKRVEPTKNKYINGIPFKGDGKNSSAEFLFFVMHVASICTPILNRYRDKAYGRSKLSIKCHVYKELCEDMALKKLKAIIKTYMDAGKSISEDIMNNEVIPTMANMFLIKDNCLVNLFCALDYITNNSGNKLSLLQKLTKYHHDVLSIYYSSGYVHFMNITKSDIMVLFLNAMPDKVIEKFLA